MSQLNHAGNEYAQRLAALSRTPEQYRVDPKVYYHHHNYARFHFDLGGSNVKSVSFANQVYVTDDKREQDQLDLVADAPGSFIYTQRGSAAEQELLAFLSQESATAIMRTAQAQAAVSNQQFDPNTPILPVQINPVSATPHLHLTPVVQPQVPQQGGTAVVGMQNSLSGTAAVETPTQPASPTPAAAAAIARLNELANQAKEQK